MEDWSRQRVLVTGGTGFLGRHVLTRLNREAAAATISAPPRSACDLLDPAACLRTLEDVRPTVVIHLAGYSGGLGAVRNHPARFFHDNLAMGVNLIEAVRRAGLVARCRFVQIGHMAAYPAAAAQPYREESLMDGPPDAAAAPYGIAKRALLTMLEAYGREHGLRWLYLIPSNLYGPGDTFDYQRSHAVGALVRRYVDAAAAGAAEVECWGSGAAVRDSVYVEDAAEAVVLAARAPEVEPRAINISTGQGLSIAALAGLIAPLAGFHGRTVWDASKPEGAAQRVLDCTWAKSLLYWTARTPPDLGLYRTVEYYRSIRQERADHHSQT